MGILLYWNRFAEGLYGWTAAEALGRNILELTPAEEVLGDAQAALARLRRGEPWSGEITLRRRDGTTFCGHISDAPVYDEAERLVAIVSISYDITERKEAEAKQALLVRELHHRVKNTLATVQAIMGSTARATETPRIFSERSRRESRRWPELIPCSRRRSGSRSPLGISFGRNWNLTMMAPSTGSPSPGHQWNSRQNWLLR